MSNSSHEGPTLSKDFSARAEAYKSFRPQYPERLFDFITEEAPGRGLAWDCGCGNGQSTLPLGDRFERVIATDISIAQLKQAWRHPHTTYLATAAETAAIAPQRADAIIVTQAVHWFNFDRFYTEVRRIARPGGLLVLVGYGLLSVDAAVDSILRRFYFDVVGAFWPPERRLLDQEYMTIPFPFREIAAPRLEIRLDWQFAQMMGYLSTWTAVENYRRHNGKDPLPALSTGLEPHWQSAQTVLWPLYIRAGRVNS